MISGMKIELSVEWVGESKPTRAKCLTTLKEDCATLGLDFVFNAFETQTRHEPWDGSTVQSIISKDGWKYRIYFFTDLCSGALEKFEDRG